MDNNMKKEIAAILKDMKKDVKHYECDEKINAKVKKALLDLELHHNTSWGVEIYRRNEDNLDSTAIKYRGNSISYEDMFNKAYRYACSLKEMGYGVGDEIPACVSNIPEFVYLFLAVSFIGAKINVVGDWFDKDYLLAILNNTGSNYMFVSDDVYENIKDVIDKSNIDNIVLFSLTDSLPFDKDGSRYNPYLVMDSMFYDFVNKVFDYKNITDKVVLNVDEFLNIGNKYNGKVIENVGLDDEFAITYTSGTTDPGCPKGVRHANRSYITLSRFKESDVSGMPSMRNLTVLAHIPTYTHMELSCAISDTLYEKCTLAMEPFYNIEFFIYSLLINKPNFVPASAGFWTNLCKKLNYDDRFKNINMPYLMLPTVTGEACSSGEEKFFNYTSRKHKFGVDKLPFPLAPVTFSIGGGTSESSGVFVTLFKSLQEKKINYLIKNNSLGLTPHKFADIEVLDENGDYCDINKPGLLVSNSPCSMIGYTNDKLNETVYVTDKYGKKWVNMGTYSYKSDSYGRIKMKGRMGSNIYLPSGEKIPMYEIEDVIAKDTKNIMSTSLVKISDDCYICHFELLPYAKFNSEKVIRSIIGRLENSFPSELLEMLYLRERNFDESFPIAPSGKRDNNKLIEEGYTDKCISCTYYVKNRKNKKNIKKLVR